MDYIFTNKFKVNKDFDLDFFKKAISIYTNEETEAEVSYSEKDLTLSFKIKDYLITTYDSKHEDFEKTKLTKREFLSLPEEVELYIQSILEDKSYCILRDGNFDVTENISLTSVIITKNKVDVIELSIEEEKLAEKLLKEDTVLNREDILTDDGLINSFLMLSSIADKKIRKKYSNEFISKAGIPYKTIIEGNNSTEYLTGLDMKEVDFIDVIVYKEDNVIVKIVEG